MNCYRETNGVYFIKAVHTPDCANSQCAGCKPCRESHCTAKRTCAVHLNDGELTCARCVGRTRIDLRRIPTVSRLMVLIAIEDGVNSEAANLAGPAADYEVFSARRRIDKAWIEANISEAHRLRAMDALLADDDEQHPYSVLGRWDLMLREDYDQPSDEPVTIDNAADYLERQLPRVAQDQDQDFALFAREIRNCRRHLEFVLKTAMRKQRGAPCPECTSEESGVGPRLIREFPHWCDDEDCERVHYDDDSADRWVCPRKSEHWWDVESYSNYVEERHATRRAAS